MTEIGGGWYTRKITKGLPPIRRPKLSKKAQEKEDDTEQKLYEASRHFNDRKFQPHWHKLEWVNPIIQIKRKKKYSVSSIVFT